MVCHSDHKTPHSNPTTLFRWYEKDFQAQQNNSLLQRKLQHKSSKQIHDQITKVIQEFLHEINLERRRPLQTAHKYNYFDDATLKKLTAEIKICLKQISQTKNKKKKEKKTIVIKEKRPKNTLELENYSNLKCGQITKILEESKKN